MTTVTLVHVPRVKNRVVTTNLLVAFFVSTQQEISVFQLEALDKLARKVL